MDFSKNIRAGRKVALKSQKKKEKLITCWVDEEFRDEVNKKCPNVSEFIRTCLEKLVASPIDKQIKKIYEDIADATIEEVAASGQSKVARSGQSTVGTGSQSKDDIEDEFDNS